MISDVLTCTLLQTSLLVMAREGKAYVSRRLTAAALPLYTLKNCAPVSVQDSMLQQEAFVFIALLLQMAQSLLTRTSISSMTPLE
jgi:hypothetical protein